MSRMAGPLAGIAAGIGLGYLFSKMGAGGFLGLLLIVGIAVVALIWFARSARRATGRCWRGCRRVEFRRRTAITANAIRRRWRSDGAAAR